MLNTGNKRGNKRCWLKVSTGRGPELLRVLVHLLGPNDVGSFTLGIWAHEKLREINVYACLHTCVCTYIHACGWMFINNKHFICEFHNSKKIIFKTVMIFDPSEGKKCISSKNEIKQRKEMPEKGSREGGRWGSFLMK